MTQDHAMTGVRDSTVDGILRRSARRVPGRTAVRYGDRSWSYADLDAAVTTAAAVLTEHGLRTGDRVASYGNNSDVYLIGFLACARSGLVHVPVNQNLTGDELAYILGQSGSALVLADPGLADGVPEGLPVRLLRGSDDSLLAALGTPGTSPRNTLPWPRIWCSCSTPRVPPRSPRAR